VDNKIEALQDLLCSFGVFLVLWYGVFTKVILLQFFGYFLAYIVYLETQAKYFAWDRFMVVLL
jgi:hypothetical protein